MELTLPLPPTTSPGELPSQQFEGSWLQALGRFTSAMLFSPLQDGGAPLLKGLGARVVNTLSSPVALVAETLVNNTRQGSQDQGRAGRWVANILSFVVNGMAGILELTAARESVVAQYTKLKKEGVTGRLLAPLESRNSLANDDLDTPPGR